MEKGPVVIVGGGVSGLSVAALLCDRSVPVVLIEKEDRPGGLARSFSYDGFIFDIGPHRFHTDQPRVDRFINHVLGPSARRIHRKSQLQFKGQFYPWPLHPSYEFLRFPPSIALSVVRDLFFGYPKPPPDTFKDHIINMYGETLYRHFFEGYSSKFLGIVPELTHPDWAQTGIDRAIIDNRLKMKNLWQLALTVINPWQRPNLRFLYPAGGCEQFARNLVQHIEGAGGQIICGKAVEELKVSGGSIAAVRVGDHLFEPSLVVWTGTIHSLAACLHQPLPELRYLALVCYNLLMTDGQMFDFQWSYHGAPDVIFSRVSIPANFDPGNTPQGMRSMCVEVTCSEEDDQYQCPELYTERLIQDMKREGLLKVAREITAMNIERIPWAYPIYQLDYKERLQAFMREMSVYRNLHLAGRLGRFWYNNMDHCIEASFELVERILTELSGR